MQDKLQAKIQAGKIVPVWHHVVDEVLGNEAGVTGLRLKSVQDESTREIDVHGFFVAIGHRSAEHTSELQSLMRISYAVLCLTKKKNTKKKSHDKQLYSMKLLS